MKTKSMAWAGGVALLGASTLAQADFSANIGATSNYVWRGVTQTDDDAAIQGGIDYAHASGFYAGTWASNVNFNPDGGGNGGEYEWDLYGGFASEFNDFGYDLGYVYYAYPDSSDTDFGEIYGSLSWKWLSGGLNYTVNSGGDGKGAFRKKDLYGYLGVGFDLPYSFSLGGTVGRYWFDDDGKTSGGEKLDLDYTHYQIDVGKNVGDFGDFTMSFAKAKKTDVTGTNNWKVFVSWAKTFD
jgi:uncharacterized protein (TIGR02001 family)